MTRSRHAAASFVLVRLIRVFSTHQLVAQEATRMSLTRRFAAATAIVSFALAGACGSDSLTNGTDGDAGHRRHGDPRGLLFHGHGHLHVALGRQQLHHRARRRRGGPLRGGRQRDGAGHAWHRHVHRRRTSRPTRCTAIASSRSIGTATSAPSSEATRHDARRSAMQRPTSRRTSRRVARLYADTVYTLKGFIHVANGATLTIQPGTKIQGDFNTLGSSLFILRGAKIDAQGTADAPIVFTSSRAAGQRQPGDWGGLILVGNAPSNRERHRHRRRHGHRRHRSRRRQELRGRLFRRHRPDRQLRHAAVRPRGVRRFRPVAGRRAQLVHLRGGGNRHAHLVSSRRWAALDDSYEFFGGGFDGDHLVAYETGDDMFDMSEGFVGPPPVPDRLQLGAAHAAHRRRLSRDRSRGHRERRLQRLGLRQRPQPAAVHDSGHRQLHADRLRRAVVRRHRRRLRHDAPPRHGRLLRQWRRGALPGGRRLAARSGDVPPRRQRRDPRSRHRRSRARNIFFAEISGTVFQANTATPANQFALDAAGNALTASTATTAALFTAIPATGAVPTGIAAFDWTPVAGSPIAHGWSGDVHRQDRHEGRHVRHRHELRRRRRRRRHEVVAGLDDLRPQLIRHHRFRMNVLGCIAAIALTGAVAACDSASGASRTAKAATDSLRADSIARVRQDSINRAQPGYVRRLDPSHRGGGSSVQRHGWRDGRRRAPACELIARRARGPHRRRRRTRRLGRISRAPRSHRANSSICSIPARRTPIRPTASHRDSCG